MFPTKNVLKQGDALSRLLFNFALEYAIWSVPVNQDGLKLNSTHHLLVCADDFNILGRSVHAVKKHTEAFAVVSKETGLEVNADKTKYMVMSRDQNAKRSHKIKRDNKSYKNVEHFKCLGTKLTKENLFHREIKSRLKTGNEVKVNLSFLSTTWTCVSPPNWSWRTVPRIFKFGSRQRGGGVIMLWPVYLGASPSFCLAALQKKGYLVSAWNYTPNCLVGQVVAWLFHYRELSAYKWMEWSMLIYGT